MPHSIQKLVEDALLACEELHRIIGTRNLLAHGYDIVDHEILWAAVQNCLSPLIKELESIADSP
jgi:uncharacterized protein with HEPN domain